MELEWNRELGSGAGERKHRFANIDEKLLLSAKQTVTHSSPESVSEPLLGQTGQAGMGVIIKESVGHQGSPDSAQASGEASPSRWH